jgi:hypothetical protein
VSYQAASPATNHCTQNEGVFKSNFKSNLRRISKVKKPVFTGESWKHAPGMERGTPVVLTEQSWHSNEGWDGQGKDAHSLQKMNGVGSGGGDRRS